MLKLKLDADITVLSACLTAGGKLLEGEGVINPARSFQYSGSRSAVVSLWELASIEAVNYMKIFYKHIKDGKQKAEALRFARREMKQKHPHPFLWAVFIIHGGN